MAIWFLTFFPLTFFLALSLFGMRNINWLLLHWQIIRYTMYLTYWICWLTSNCWPIKIETENWSTISLQFMASWLKRKMKQVNYLTFPILFAVRISTYQNTYRRFDKRKKSSNQFINIYCEFNCCFSYFQ